jgi:hypothetical protein
VQGLLGELALFYVLPQRSQPTVATLAPVVDDDLVHDVGEGELDGAHGPVGHHQCAGFDPFGLELRLWPGQA